jgi:phosphate:Na+ symporter
VSGLLVTLGTFLGGLGLFLLAVGMLTDGLRLAAGDQLRSILARSTRTPARGVGSGILFTAVVQSSSAVTVATIGFVNAGLLTLVQALGVVYGANIGTTVTGWLVAAVGFSWKIEVLALPLIGAGMLLRLTGSSSRLGAAGEALAGFGLFFIGVDVLRDAFDGVAAAVDPAALAVDGWLGVLVYLGVGVLMTVVTQSSSAAIAITLTAASGGVIGLEAAAAAVIGANVGTTSTALLATIGATPAARRVAMAHVAFNLVTAAVALAILPLVLWAVDAIGDAVGLGDAPAATLALFHTLFNVLGVVIMLPLTGPLARFLERRFRRASEDAARPRYLDHTLAATPLLALDALVLELARLLGQVRGQFALALDRESGSDRAVAEAGEAVDALAGAVALFLRRMERTRMTDDVAAEIPVVLRVLNYVEDVRDLAGDVGRGLPALASVPAGPLGERVERFRGETLALAHAADPTTDDFDGEALEARREALDRDWHELKDALLEAAADGVIPLERLDPVLDGLRAGRRAANQMLKAGRRLHGLAMRRPPATMETAAGGAPVSVEP